MSQPPIKKTAVDYGDTPEKICVIDTQDRLPTTNGSLVYELNAEEVVGPLTQATIDGSDITGTIPGDKVSGAIPNATVDGGDITGTIPGDKVSGTLTNANIDVTNVNNLTFPPPNNATITLSAGNAITGGGSFTTDQSGNATITFNHQDTSSQGSVNNSGNTFIQDIALDAYGHITSLTSGTATASVTSSAVGTAFSGINFGSVGSIALAYVTSGAAIAANTNIAGSSLKQPTFKFFHDNTVNNTGVDGVGLVDSTNGVLPGTVLSGTWKSLQALPAYTFGFQEPLGYHFGLFVKVA